MTHVADPLANQAAVALAPVQVQNADEEVNLAGTAVVAPAPAAKTTDDVRVLNTTNDYTVPEETKGPDSSSDKPPLQVCVRVRARARVCVIWLWS